MYELCEIGKETELEKFLQENDVDSSDLSGIGEASSSAGFYSILTILINHGLNAKNPDLLPLAAHNGHLNCVELLLQHGADGTAIMHTTAYNNHQEVEKFLDNYLAGNVDRPISAE